MKKFEYMSFKDGLSDGKLNEIGSKGWELVSHSAVYVPNNRSRELIQYYVFKKEIKPTKDEISSCDS